MHFLISGVATANQARLQQKLDSFHFLNERCFSLFIFEVDCVTDQRHLMFACSFLI